MIVNNFEKIKEMLEFKDDDHFYYLQILKNEKMLVMKKGQKVIKNYYIRSLKYFEDKKKEIIDLCTQNNARAYMRLNKRSYKKCTLQMMKLLANIIISQNYQVTSRL